VCFKHRVSIIDDVKTVKLPRFSVLSGTNLAYAAVVKEVRWHCAVLRVRLTENTIICVRVSPGMQYTVRYWLFVLLVKI